VKLRVPGASLYYEVRGSGPVLLMMPGGRPSRPGRTEALRAMPGSSVKLREVLQD